jgi:hypothetical protein
MVIFCFKSCTAVASVLQNNQFCEKKYTEIGCQSLSLLWSPVSVGGRWIVAVGGVRFNSVEKLQLSV